MMRMKTFKMIIFLRLRFFFQGAEINPLDKENRSPLLLAASRAGWRTVLTLIRLKANILLKDSSYRNILSLVVMNGGRLEDFAQEVLKVCSFSIESLRRDTTIILAFSGTI